MLLDTQTRVCSQLPPLNMLKVYASSFPSLLMCLYAQGLLWLWLNCTLCWAGLDYCTQTLKKTQKNSNPNNNNNPKNQTVENTGKYIFYPVIHWIVMWMLQKRDITQSAVGMVKNHKYERFLNDATVVKTTFITSILLNSSIIVKKIEIFNHINIFIFFAAFWGYQSI